MKFRELINQPEVVLTGSLLVQTLSSGILPTGALAADRKALKREESQQLRLLLRDIIYLEQNSWQKKLADPDKSERVNSVKKLLEKTSVRLEPDIIKLLQNSLKKLESTKPADGNMNATVRTFRHEISDAFQIDSSPARTPDAGVGQNLFLKDCMSCHGHAGDGKGPLSAKLPKAPSSWLVSDHLQSQAPLMILNTLLLGSPGSSMPSFEAHYSHHELWSLSFLIPCFPFLEKLGSRQLQWKKLNSATKEILYKKGLNYSFLARRTDTELLNWINRNIPESDRQGWSDNTWKEILRGGAVFSSELPRR